MRGMCFISLNIQEGKLKVVYFTPPNCFSFYDNRILISWSIIQPPELPPLKNLTFRINSNSTLSFIPPQSDSISLPELDNNHIIINWVIERPMQPIEVCMSLECDVTTEKHHLRVE